MTWFRLDDDVINDPKILLLPEQMRWIWIAFLCIASKNAGRLPNINIIALSLRVKTTKAAEYLTRLVKAGLIDEDETGFSPHNWTKRQFKSDVSTERVKRFRQHERNVSETPPQTQTQTQTQRKKDSADAGSSKIAFESGIIRLNQKDFDLWKASYSHLDLRAELVALTQWAGDQGARWFHAVPNALAKRNREVKAAKDKLTADGGFKWNGQEGVI